MITLVFYFFKQFLYLWDIFFLNGLLASAFFVFGPILFLQRFVNLSADPFVNLQRDSIKNLLYFAVHNVHPHFGPNFQGKKKTFVLI